MQTSAEESAERLELLRRTDRFRDWRSLDDKRICVVCGRQFSGHDVRTRRTGEIVELHCPTKKCESGLQDWIYPANSLVSEVVFADWWRSLGESVETVEAARI